MDGQSNTEDMSQNETNVSKDDEINQETDLFIKVLESTNTANNSEIHSFLENLPENTAASVLKKIREKNVGLVEENDAYKFFLENVEGVQDVLDKFTIDQDSIEPTDCLSYPEKCFVVNKKLEHLSTKLEDENQVAFKQMKDLQCDIQSLDVSLASLKYEKEIFDNVRIGGRHPVTKKVILQKVAKYFDDSIKHKMMMVNRHKINIESFVAQNNKLKDQIKEQEKRAATLDLFKFKEAEINHEKTSETLSMLKKELVKWKSKQNLVAQKVLEMKGILESEKVTLQKLSDAVLEKEGMKDVIATEKARNNQRVEEMNLAIRKIQLDPRRHGLPEVTEYVLTKRRNNELKQTLKKWKSKVQLVEQAKLIHLDALKKKAKKRDNLSC